MSGPTPPAARSAWLASSQRPRIWSLSWLVSVSRFWYRRGAAAPSSRMPQWSVLWLDGSGHRF